MPFVATDHRKNPDPFIPGDRCYVKYKYLVDSWRKQPRWTTADRLFTELSNNKKHCICFINYNICEYCIAADLAWQVFFQFHVLPYEAKKEVENGTI